MKKIYFIIGVLTVLSTNSYSQSVTDVDGNIYQTVQIGDQVWMKENLKTIHYSNGDTIANLLSNVKFGTYQNYDNDTNNSSIYGRLYNWFAVKDSRNICPKNWHIPSLNEWQTLVDYLGGNTVAGGKMKKSGTQYWSTPNTGATNESGFSGLPGGQSSGNGFYGTLHQVGVWYSSTVGSDTNKAWMLDVYYLDSKTTLSAYSKSNGLSVRCLKDTTVSIIENNNFDFQIFPNPAKDYISIFYNNFQSPALTIYNLMGEIILMKRLNSNNGIIDINTLSQGVYLIGISSKRATILRKLIVE